MQKIKSSELKTNMKFTSPVFFDDGINMFLSENNPLTENHIELIKNSGHIPGVEGMDATLERIKSVCQK